MHEKYASKICHLFQILVNYNKFCSIKDQIENV